MKQRQHVWVDDVASVVDLPDLLPDIEWAYHQGEIWHALDALSPREKEYVTMRFRQGQPLSELKNHFGYDPSGLWHTARPKLAKELAHLGVHQ
jgi:DNA-directed RNA polymerase specialized sigma24 family protein